MSKILKLKLVKFIHFLHIFYFVLVLFSIYYPSGNWLIYNIILLILTFINWNDKDKQCILTKLEYKLKGKWKPGKSSLDDSPEFFRPLINKIFKYFNYKITSRKLAGIINYGAYIIIMVINIIRFIKLENKIFNLKPESIMEKIHFYYIIICIILYIYDFMYL